MSGRYCILYPVAGHICIGVNSAISPGNIMTLLKFQTTLSIVIFFKSIRLQPRPWQSPRHRPRHLVRSILFGPITLAILFGPITFFVTIPTNEFDSVRFHVHQGICFIVQLMLGMTLNKVLLDSLALVWWKLFTS
jgi:hypothetical protein